ncbi:MAG: outer membrane protein transport protein, partial [Prevotellaceae bacterium]|nr:outer membrane protein transport protein [Prevotellaceae bacterium]
MKRKLFFSTLALLGFSSSVFAGGLLTNTNQNVTFLRNLARGASIEIDAAYTNPAGLAFLKGDGFFISLNNQSAFQTRTITAEFAPFAGMGGKAIKKFEGKITAWIIPNLQAAYKFKKWVFSANIGAVGGGGTLDYSMGLPSFESAVAITPAFLSGIPALSTMGFGGYDLESQLKGSSMIIGTQVGVTYTIVKYFSAYLGARYNHVSNGYEGHIRNTKLGMSGNLTPVATVVSALSSNPQLAGLVDALAGEKKLDCSQSGSGIAPIIGLNFNFMGLNVGAKYEFKTALEVKNKTTTNTTGVADYDDGAITPYDIPALLTVGAQYNLFSKLVVSAGYHHFFDSDAKMANDKQKFINGGVNEYLAGVEYRINKMFLVSCGAQITRQGVTDDYQSDMNFSVNSYSLGFGGAISIKKNI